MTKRKLCFLTKYDVSRTPFAELYLPALAKAGWDITLVAPGASRSLMQRVQPYPCQTHELPSAFGRSWWKHEINLGYQLVRTRLKRYDAVVLWGQPISSRAIFYLLGPKFGRRIIYHSSDYFDSVDNRMKCILEGWLCRKADLYLNGEFHRAFIERDRYRIRCPVEMSPFYLPSNWPVPARNSTKRTELCGEATEDCFVLMLHSPFSRHRMVPQLFEALSRLPARYRLAMTGGRVINSNPHAQTLLDRLRIRERVTFLPPLDYQEVFKYTVNADAGILLYPGGHVGSFFQGPGRFTEYLACGLPLLMPNFTGFENLAYRYGIGVCVDPHDPKDIARGICQLEEAQYDRGYLRKIFQSYFAFDHWAPQICEAFEAVLSTRPRQHRAPPPRRRFPSSLKN